ILLQLCGSLGEAHELGIVHRDLKPENVVVSRTKDGGDFAKLLDFGLAKVSAREEPPDASTQGALIGTPYYMSPEQINADREPDARSDIYSLGALMYRILTGEPPFLAATPVAVLTRHLSDAPQSLRERRPDLNLPESVDELVLHALAKRPEDRFQ